MSKDALIAKAILDAQIASDGGKGITKTKHMNKYVWSKGYSLKDVNILKAINLIVSQKNSRFRFKVVECEQFSSLLVYFETKISGKKYQVSFHSYGFDMFNKYIKHNEAVHLSWDEKSSQKSAIFIAKNVR